MGQAGCQWAGLVVNGLDVNGPGWAGPDVNAPCFNGVNGLGQVSVS